MGSACITKSYLATNEIQYGEEDKFLYRFERPIGRGSFGKVWKAIDKKTNTPHAIKIMKKTDIVSKKMVDYILKEREILSQLNHPFVVNMTRSFQDRRFLYLVMEYMPHGDLRSFQRHKDLLTQKNVKFIAHCILIGLQHLHYRNIIHRDIKPQNILVDDKGYFRIGDFGLSTYIVPGEKPKPSGTISYMSPEIYFKDSQTYTVDYFSLGILLYEIFVGKRPTICRNSNNYEQMIKKNQSIKIPETTIPTITTSCVQFINSLIEINPKKRLGSNGIEQIFQHPWIKMPKEELKQITTKSKDNKIWRLQHSDLEQSLCQKVDNDHQDSLIQTLALERDIRFQRLFQGYQHIK